MARSPQTSPKDAFSSLHELSKDSTLAMHQNQGYSTSMATDTVPIFREAQQSKPLWVWAVVLPGSIAPGILLLGLLIRQLHAGVPIGTRPMSNFGLAVTTFAVLLLGAALLWLIAKWQLVVEVLPDGLFVHMRPFYRRTIAWADIESAQARTYRPLAEYGGWGMRGTRKNRALNLSGNRGVQLVLKGGDRLLLGSQDPEPLCAAICRQLPQKSSQ